MTDRKTTEIEYYEKQAGEQLKRGGTGLVDDFEGFRPESLSSFRYLYSLLKENCSGKTVLDYGCGNGVHTGILIKAGAAKVIGIDLSEKSLEIARERMRREGLEGKAEFLPMDCEKMTFPDNYFDVILDGGTFSSLDLKVALPELSRILRPEGILIGIETFGHNPLTNLKRRLNKVLGKRTGWAQSHIVRQESLSLAGDYFGEIKVNYFHLISWLAIPFLSLPGGKTFLKVLEAGDRILSKASFFKKCAFKIVFTFSKPNK
jgi:ubiquinone/menaquinone biosynthesis C-methylase UbiE